MVLLKSLSSSLVDRRAVGPVTFCHFELAWLEELPEMDMKSLTNVLGKELADSRAECLHLLLVVMMVDDVE
jgi:hypothetical protein